MQHPAFSRTSWLFKFCESLLAAVAILNVLMMSLELLPPAWLEPFGQYFEYVLLGSIGLALISSLVYTVLWHRREQAGTVQSGLRHAWLQGIIRYWLAFEISIYGFAKILKTQFDTPTYRLDIPLGELDGFSLTWYYFGYSYTLAVIIALFQISGSILLLYRRTTLLGVMILLPVMVNIVFINLFFSIASGAFFNSMVFTLGLLFLLVLDAEKLKRTFWDLVERLPPVSLGHNSVKHGVRLLPIAIAFSFIFYLAQRKMGDTVLKGTWKVERLTRNGQVVPTTAWLTDTTAWNRVYFAGWQGVAFSPNPYRYKPAECLRGQYEFDSLKNTVRLMLYRSDKAKTAPADRPDTLQATLSNRTQKAMRLRGIWYGDTLDMQLARLR